MDGRISTMYQELLLELRKRLDEADALYLRMSKTLIGLMTTGGTAETFRVLDAEYRACLTEVLEGAARLYPGRIELFSFETGDIAEGMERRHAQFEELERVIDLLLEQNGCPKRISKEKRRKRMEKTDCAAEFEREFREAEKLCRRPNVLVAGYTGCGKTSLIRTVLGGEIVPKTGIGDGKPCRIEFDCYENETIRLWDSRGLELGEREADFRTRMKEFVEERQGIRSPLFLNMSSLMRKVMEERPADIKNDATEHIHLVWYLIQGNSARVTDCDLALIREIFPMEHVIVAISKRDITKPRQAEEIRRILTEAGVLSEHIIEVSDAEGGALGCRELVALSEKMLPEAFRDAFIAAQHIDREAKTAKIREKAEDARLIIQQAIHDAKRLAETPLPIGETASLLPPLAGMAAKLAALYGLRENSFRKEAAGFVETVVNAFSRSLDELFPETAFGIGPETAGILTGAIGRYLKNSFEAYALARIREAMRPGLNLDLEQFKTFFKTYRQGVNMKPNILVCGKTGVGKTSLIQAVTHRGVVPDSAIGDGGATTRGFRIYPTAIADFIDSEGMNPGLQSVDEYADFILNEILARLDSDDKGKLIHNIWYCIDGSGARIQEADARLIRTFSDRVILVVTKCELMRKEQIESVMNALLELMPRDRIVMVSAETKTGLRQLIARAEEMSARAAEEAEEELDAFRDRWDGYYAAMRRTWQNGVGSDADDYINWAAGRAAAIAIIPLPLADVGPLIANEAYMFYKLGALYGYAVDKTILTGFLGCVGASIGGKLCASLIPFLKIPIAAAVTYGVGKAAKAYFESGMVLDSETLKAEFLAGEREARKRDWKPVSEK